ncbi:MAG: hypothetical protein AcusKO_29310 [Acuticoccus sp.]
MDFSEAIKAQLAGERVRVDALVEFSFLSDTVRLWNGFGTLKTSDDRNWEGIGGIGRIDGLEQSVDGTAPEQTFTLSGVDSRFAALAKGSADEYYRRPVSVFLQFFDDDWQTLDSPLAISLRHMERLKATRAQGDEGFVYTVSITAETPFTTRRRPPFSYYTDRDQQRRFPGDRGCEEIAGIEGKKIVFPDY